MSALVFVDTSVLIYAMDDADRTKQEAARAWRVELWKTRRGRISFQVLQEFYAQVTKKWPSAGQVARSEIRDLLAWQPVVVDDAILEQGWKTQDRLRLSFWDSLIVAAAKAASCRYLLTEDLQADQNLDGLVVVDPFATDPESILDT